MQAWLGWRQYYLMYCLGQANTNKMCVFMFSSTIVDISQSVSQLLAVHGLSSVIIGAGR